MNDNRSVIAQFEPEPVRQSELDAIIAMIEYLIPEARKLSPSVALHLHLAKHELTVMLSLPEDGATKLQS